MYRASALKIIALAAVCTSIATTHPALAQEDSPGLRKEWDVTLGVGGGVRPTYMGSDQYRVMPLPLVNIVWRDTIALDNRGLNAYWRADSLTIGGGLTFDPGRTQSSGAFSQGDGRLNGMGDIPAALGVKGFASYKLGPVMFETGVTKLTADGNNGVLVDFGIGAPVRISDRTMLMGRVFTTWADQNYMQQYFGVTGQQSANSGYARYDASSGFRDIGIGLGLRQKLDTNWTLGVNGGVQFLTGDAAASPLTRSNTNFSLFSTIAYRF
jgi:MipA family protein